MVGEVEGSCWEQGQSCMHVQAAITVSSIICIVWTLIAPDRNASWAMLREDLRANIEILDDAKVSSQSITTA